LTENVAFLIDCDPNLTVFDMDEWAYAVVDNLLRKGNTGDREPARGGQARGRAKSHGTWNLEPACRQAGLKLGTAVARQMTND